MEITQLSNLISIVYNPVFGSYLQPANFRNKSQSVPECQECLSPPWLVCNHLQHSPSLLLVSLIINLIVFNQVSWPNSQDKFSYITSNCCQTGVNIAMLSSAESSIILTVRQISGC